MFEIKATHGRILFTVHTDDADCIVEDERDAKEFLRVMNSMFSVAGNPGIKVVDVGVMLCSGIPDLFCARVGQAANVRTARGSFEVRTANPKRFEPLASRY
eukprot:COSAG01_NODE_6545_length_3613_cov_53.783722_5_plen_100_part_01